MRLTGGFACGRQLTCPRGRATRPTPARVREALFSMLGPPAGPTLDLFAGSGALGLESLSRGSPQATFVERAPAALACLRRNLAPFAPHARLLATAAAPAVAVLAREGCRFDLIFVDPPYDAGLAPWALAAIQRAGLLAEGGRIVVEQAAGQPAPAPPDGLRQLWRRAWGEVAAAAFTSRL